MRSVAISISSLTVERARLGMMIFVNGYLA
jgi:hypothetical protein